ncbi:MAG: glycerophosphodiester phosphodiesterase [Muribaculaceae bacterium]|nr:glycerophosphodiester phosphodiesterase [Muribaculaceae bacterium]
MRIFKLLAIAGILSISVGTNAAAQTTKAVAHRGFWNTENSAQNSLASFVKADSIGCYGSEIDVWLTTDDHLIVNHDKVFHGLFMETAPFEKIREIILPNGEKIPTLDEYLAVVREHPETRLVLEMKSLTDYSREDVCAEKIAGLLRKHGLLDRTDIIVFSLNAAMTFKKIFPAGVKIFYLDGDLTPKKIKKLGLAGIDYSVKVLKKHPEWVEQAHKEGVEVNVWTVNSEEDMKYFIDLGVDYITTDNPDRLVKILASYKPTKGKKDKKKTGKQ